MIRSLALAAVLLAPLQAAALSCSVPPEHYDIINAVHGHNEVWALGVGRMKPIFGGTTREKGRDGYIHISQTYQFEGVLLRGEKPDQPIATKVTATSCEGLWCLGPWTLDDRLDYLMVFEIQDGRLTLHNGMCFGSLILELDSPEYHERVTACAATGTCAQADLAR